MVAHSLGVLFQITAGKFLLSEKGHGMAVGKEAEVCDAHSNVCGIRISA